jgi:hypothetical protein
MKWPIALAVMAVAAPALAGERVYSVTDFDRISVEGPYIVHLVTGRPTTARATGNTAALDRLRIDVSGQTLRIRRNRDYWGGNEGAQEGIPTIELTTRTLRSARLIGPARLDLDRLEGQRVDLAVEGSGALSAGDVAADTLSIGLAGSGRIELAGRANALTADLQGTGDLVASRLTAQDATITSATSGSVSLTAARSATVTALGVGSVTIGGRPACTVRGPAADRVACGAPGALPRN